MMIRGRLERSSGVREGGAFGRVQRSGEDSVELVDQDAEPGDASSWRRASRWMPVLMAGQLVMLVPTGSTYCSTSTRRPCS